MKKTETPDPEKVVRRAKTAANRKVGARKKNSAPKRGGAGPSAAADQSSDSEWIVGPYGDLMSKKDLGLLVTTRTRVS